MTFCLRIQHRVFVEGGMITGCRISLTALNLKKLDSNMTYFDFAIKFNTKGREGGLRSTMRHGATLPSVVPLLSLDS